MKLYFKEILIDHHINILINLVNLKGKKSVPKSKFCKVHRDYQCLPTEERQLTKPISV